MYKAPPKRELSEEERITVNMGGTLAPTAAPGGIAGTGVTAVFAQYQAQAREQESLGFLQVASRARVTKRAAPPPPPATAGAYKKAGEESNGVMTMLDIMITDLTKASLSTSSRAMGSTCTPTPASAFRSRPFRRHSA